MVDGKVVEGLGTDRVMAYVDVYARNSTWLEIAVTPVQAYIHREVCARGRR